MSGFWHALCSQQLSLAVQPLGLRRNLPMYERAKPDPIFTTEQNMSFNRLSGIPPRKLSMPTLVCAGQSSQASFVIWPLAPLQGPWQEIYRIAQEKAQATMLPEPTVRFACWN
jgi:hypothetical protein